MVIRNRSRQGLKYLLIRSAEPAGIDRVALTRAAGSERGLVFFQYSALILIKIVQLFLNK